MDTVSYTTIGRGLKANATRIEDKCTRISTSTSSICLRKHKSTKDPTLCVSQNPQRRKSFTEASSSTEKHLKSLNSCLGPHKDDLKEPSSCISNQKAESFGRSGRFDREKGLTLLEDYLAKVETDTNEKNSVASAYGDKEIKALQEESLNTNSETHRTTMRNETETRIKVNKDIPKSADDDFSNFYLIGVFISINIAVFLFEIATPVKNSEFELFSLPLIYGAKINNSILIGEWWRLVTPMFLHAGIFHIALGSWILFSFGPQVSRQYGSFTFFFIYILGGISGNLISFLHTPEPTVGGTGPVFAIIGAWLIYQVQNRDVIAKDDSEGMFWKAIIFTLLSLLLSNFGLIDDWSHFGAVITGIAYGFFTCTTLQMKDASSQGTGQEERITLVRQYANPCKSLMFFSIFLLLLSSLLLIIEPPLYFL